MTPFFRNGTARLMPTAAADEIAKLTEEFLVPAIVQRWREAVLADVKADPFTEAEQAHRHQGDDAAIAYGSTLLLGMVLRDWLILAQIGDGDVVGVRADGRSVLPVPTDPQLDGLVTTSLCGLDPRRRLQGRGRRYGAQRRCWPCCWRPTATATPR